MYKDNHQAVRFYVNNGFTINTERVDDHTGYPELVMKLSRSEVEGF